jgi:hypothetical protein
MKTMIQLVLALGIATAGLSAPVSAHEGEHWGWHHRLWKECRKENKDADKAVLKVCFEKKKAERKAAWEKCRAGIKPAVAGKELGRHQWKEMRACMEAKGFKMHHRCHHHHHQHNDRE